MSQKPHLPLFLSLGITRFIITLVYLANKNFTSSLKPRFLLCFGYLLVLVQQVVIRLFFLSCNNNLTLCCSDSAVTHELHEIKCKGEKCSKCCSRLLSWWRSLPTATRDSPLLSMSTSMSATGSENAVSTSISPSSLPMVKPSSSSSSSSSSLSSQLLFS